MTSVGPKSTPPKKTKISLYKDPRKIIYSNTIIFIMNKYNFFQILEPKLTHRKFKLISKALALAEFKLSK